MNFKDFFNSVLFLEANPDKRKIYLKNKYGEKLVALLKLYEKSADDLDDVLSKIVMIIDPTKGDYSEWITKNIISKFYTDYQKNKDSEYGYISPDPVSLDRFFQEDWYKIHDDLKDYQKYKKFFKKVAEEENDPDIAKLTDINHIKGFSDLYRKLELISDYIDQDKEGDNLKMVEKDAEKVYVSENYYIIVPKTQEASCVYGKGTRWCTAATGSYNYFNQYNKQGPLYIVIDRKGDEKFQFHFQSAQYMDAEDHPIKLDTFFEEHAELKPIIARLAYKNEKVSMAIELDSSLFDEAYEKYKNGENIELFPKLINENLSLLMKLAGKDIMDANHVQTISYRYKDKSFEFVNNEDVWVNSHAKDWVQLVDFIAPDSNRTRNRSYAEEVLEGSNESVYSDYSYDSSYWDYVNNEGLQNVQNYIFNTYDVEIPLDDVKEYIDENGISDVQSLLTRAFNDLNESFMSNILYTAFVETIQESLGKEMKWESETLWFKWKISRLNNVISEINNSLVESNDDKMSVPDFVESYASFLEETDELGSVNTDLVLNDYPSVDAENIEIFNERLDQYFKDELDVTPINKFARERQRLAMQGQTELDLSSINRNMSENKTAFDKVYGDILLELNFGKGGMSNMSGNTQQQSNPAAGNVANTPVQGGVDMKFAGKPKFASTTPGASTQAAAAANTQQPGLGANAVTNPATDPQEIEEFTNLLSSRQHNPQQFSQATQKLSQDPVRFSRFVDFITQSIK